MKVDKNNSCHVVIIGSYLVALVIKVNRFPIVGETVHGHGYFETHGGKGANMAVQAARLGASCTFIGNVGDDSYGKSFRDLLAFEGINSRFLGLEKNRLTGKGFVMVGPDGQNMIAIDSGANAQLTPVTVKQALSLAPEPSVVLTQLEIPLDSALYGIQIARDRGSITILNPAPAIDLRSESIDSIDIITPNETEARVCLGLEPCDKIDEVELGHWFLEQGCGAVVLTMGERGCMCITPERSDHVPGFKVPNIVDTTGAGDAFNAALAVAIAEGSTLLEAARFGNAVAALCCTKIATLPAYHDRPQVNDFIEAEN